MSQMIANGQPSQAEAEFREKMKERMRAAMGDLMPDEVLKGIVARGIEEAFFTGTNEAPCYANHYTAQRHPSWMAKFLEQEARQQVQQAVEKWVAENPERVTQLMAEAIGDGLAAAFLKGFSRLLTPALANLQEQVYAMASKLSRG
jgi:hypothetical protein